MNEKYHPPTQEEIKARYVHALTAVFKRRRDLEARYKPSNNGRWKETLAENLAQEYCAAREIYWNEVGYRPDGGKPPIPLENMHLYTYQILLDQNPLFDRIPRDIRAHWAQHAALFAELRDHSIRSDPAVKRLLADARRRRGVRERKRVPRARRARPRVR